MLPYSTGYSILTGPDESVPVLRILILYLKKSQLDQHTHLTDFQINLEQEE